MICTKAIGTFFKRLTELFHILGNIEHYFLVNNFYLFFHTAYQGLPANAAVFPVVAYLLLCFFVVVVVFVRKYICFQATARFVSTIFICNDYTA